MQNIYVVQRGPPLPPPAWCRYSCPARPISSAAAPGCGQARRRSKLVFKSESRASLTVVSFNDSIENGLHVLPLVRLCVGVTSLPALLTVLQPTLVAGRWAVPAAGALHRLKPAADLPGQGKPHRFIASSYSCAEYRAGRRALSVTKEW